MLNKCDEIGSQLSILFNSSKSKCITIAPNKINEISKLTLNNKTLDLVDKIKYLWIWICAGKCFEIDLAETRQKFFISVNSILNKCQFTCDMVKLQLIESHCLPIILYATCLALYVLF